MSPSPIPCSKQGHLQLEQVAGVFPGNRGSFTSLYGYHGHEKVLDTSKMTELNAGFFQLSHYGNILNRRL